jgi:lysophospholipase L1-like esterase
MKKPSCNKESLFKSDAVNYLALILTGLLFMIFSCSGDTDVMEEVLSEEEPSPVTEEPVTSEVIEYTYLALGDSYTIGQGVAEHERWPNQLKTRLRTANIDLTEVTILARTGWTTSALLSAIRNEKPKNHDLVSLLIGVNNQYQNLSFNSFKNEFDQLLDLGLSLTGVSKKLFVVSVPDYGVTPFGIDGRQTIANEIDMYNAYIREQCEQLGIPFIDVTYLSRQLGDSRGALAEDNLHPSASQYSKWVDLIYPIALDLLK